MVFIGGIDIIFNGYTSKTLRILVRAQHVSCTCKNRNFVYRQEFKSIWSEGVSENYVNLGWNGAFISVRKEKNYLEITTP